MKQSRIVEASIGRADESADYSPPPAKLVGQLARSGAAWSLAMHGGTQVISLVATMVLSRILLPDDFGLIAMVTSFTLLLRLFADFGLSWATMQKRNLTLAQIHNLFWLNVIVGFALCGVMILLAPAIADFYGRPDLREVTIVLSGTFIVAGTAVQPTALIKRQMKFKKFCGVVVLSSLLGASAGILAAIWGAGYWALIIQIIVSQGVRSILVVWLTKYRPGRIARGVETRSLISFGGFVAAASVSIYIAKSFDNIVVGRVSGSEQLGYYSRAYFVVMLPAFLGSSVMSHVMVPTLSALNNDRERLASAFGKAVGASCALSFPMSFGLAVLAPVAVKIVYGDNWQPVVPILIWMSIAGLFQPLYETAGWLFVSSGHGRPYFISSVVGMVALAIGAIIGVRWGPIGVAIASSVLWPLAMTIPALLVSHRISGIKMASTMAAIRIPFVASVTMAASVVMLGMAFSLVDFPWIPTVAIQVAMGILVYIAILLCFWKDFPIALRNRMRWT